MTIFKQEYFEFEGKNYEIRTTKKTNEFEVRVFQNGPPANGYFYTASFEINSDYLHDHGVAATAHLGHIARNDVENKIWEHAQSVLASNK